MPAGRALADDISARYAAKREFEGITPESLQELYRLYGNPRGHGRTGPMAVPDVFGHGAVLTAGKVVEKVTNFGFNGNPFLNTSSDPSGQWPGQSGFEYLFSQAIAIGGVNPGVSAGDPVSRRRVSSGLEWRPPSLAPEDRIYASFEGIINGKRFSNDDGDRNPSEPLEFLQDKVDEDFLDGRDNDGDGQVDEDYGALGQQMYSLVMRDDTPEAIRFTQAEPHVPVGLEIRERAWAYSVTALENFNVFEYQIVNVSGHEIDSLYVAIPIDLDAGPTVDTNYFGDDLDVPTFPSGHFTLTLPGVPDSQEPRLQRDHDPVVNDIYPALAGRPLCTQLDIRVNGFAVADDNGDEGKTLGIPMLLLFDHTIDPLGVNGPSRVGFRAFRSFGSPEPFIQGGPPRIDQQRFQLMSSDESIDPVSGFISHPGGDEKGDYAAWGSMGPWLHLQPGASVSVTIGFAVDRSKGDNPYREITNFAADYAAVKADSAAHPQNYMSRQADLFSDYPALKTAFDAQVAFEGIWEPRRDGFASTDWHGRETGIRGLHNGPTITLEDCRDVDGEGGPRQVFADEYTWFDFDCNFCTGVWSYPVGNAQDAEHKYLGGLFHKTWNSSAPPPSPILNTGSAYNFTDNPTRIVAAAGDRRITLAWDNSSQVSPDPGAIRGARNVFDFRGYNLYKVSGWTRPVGSPGPAENEWALIASFTMFDYRDSLNRPIPDNAIGWTGPDATGSLLFPRVLYPGRQDSSEVRLFRGDLWDRQSGKILTPDTSLPCVPGDPSVSDSCLRMNGCASKCGRSVFPPFPPDTLIQYPVGRYRYVDTEVKNGFKYFYSVTAYDSSLDGSSEGRKSAVEAEGVAPQASTVAGGRVWVVPNPYKGYQRLLERPSTWDLTPNATDPTGTHIDFMGLPPGRWTIKIYTVSGDLVQEIRSTDAVNESLRGPVTTPGGTLPGYNRQQDTASDGQASWNLITRNGQDVVSGVYLFTVNSSEGTQRGRFVVIR